MFEHLAAILIHLVGLSPEETCPKLVIVTKRGKQSLSGMGYLEHLTARITGTLLQVYLFCNKLFPCRLELELQPLDRNLLYLEFFFLVREINKRFSSATNCCVHIIQVKLINIDSISSLSFKYLCSSVYISL